MTDCEALRQFRNWNRQNNAGLPTECPADGNQMQASEIHFGDLLSRIPAWEDGMSLQDYRQAMVERQSQIEFAEQLLPRIYTTPEQQYKMLSDQPTCDLCGLCFQIIGQNELMADGRKTFGRTDSVPRGSRRTHQRGGRIPINAANLPDDN